MMETTNLLLMKRSVVIPTLLIAQVTAVLLLARIVRMPAWRGHVNVLLSDAFVFGLSALLAFIGYLRFAFIHEGVNKSRVACVLAALFFSVIGHVASVIVLSTSDLLLTNLYIARVQPRLHSDPRFADIRLICMSCDFILFPYIPISGSVATEEDRRALLHILHQARPPAHTDAVIIRIGNTPPSIQELVRRLREDDKVP